MTMKVTVEVYIYVWWYVKEGNSHVSMRGEAEVHGNHLPSLLSTFIVFETSSLNQTLSSDHCDKSLDNFGCFCVWHLKLEI